MTIQPKRGIKFFIIGGVGKMSNADWGIKRRCPECGKKFYDFNKSPIICPCEKKIVIKVRKRTSNNIPSKDPPVDEEKVLEVTHDEALPNKESLDTEMPLVDTLEDDSSES